MPTVAESIAAKKLDITSAPPPAQPLSEEERKELLTNLRNTMGRSRLEVKGPKDMYAYWARRDDASEMSRLEAFGFRVVIDDPKSRRYQASGARDDGTYILGDVILMEVPMEVHDFLFSENLKTAASLVASAQENFVNEAERAGMPTFQVNKKEDE